MSTSKSINGRIMILGLCPICSKDMGFRKKYDLDRPCRPCATRKAKSGKPSPLKGRKTGKPAWNRKVIDPIHKVLRSRLSRRMRHSLAGRGLSKNWLHIFDMLGYSPEQLKQHLESKFELGMTWENKDRWHVDHIVPDSWFTYSSIDDEQFKECWALENLQPMWESENMSKNNRYSGPYKEGG